MKTFLGIVCALSIAFSGCGPKAPRKIKVGLSMETLRGERWVKDRDAFVARVNALGGEVLIQVANGSDQLQNSQVDNLLTLGADILVIIPHNGQTAAAAVEAAHRAGKKVVSYDRLIRDCDVDLYISFDNVRVGEVMADYVVKRIPRGNYFVLNGPSTDNNALLIQQGFHHVLDPLVKSGAVTIAMEQSCNDWMTIEALKHVENALTQSGNRVDAILTAYDGLAGGVAQALAEQKLSGKVAVTGQDAELDACKRVVEGTQAMTVYKPVKLLATAAAEAAMAMARGEAVAAATRTVNNGKGEIPSVLLEPIAVDKTNLDDRVIADGYQTKESVYGK